MQHSGATAGARRGHTSGGAIDPGDLTTSRTLQQQLLSYRWLRMLQAKAEKLARERAEAEALFADGAKEGPQASCRTACSSAMPAMADACTIVGPCPTCYVEDCCSLPGQAHQVLLTDCSCFPFLR